MLKKLVESFENNKEIEEILRERLSLKDKDIALLKRENEIISQKLKLSIGVFRERPEFIKEKLCGSESLSNPDSLIFKSDICGSEALSNPDSLICKSVDYSEAGNIYLILGFILHTIIDGNNQLPVFQFTGHQFELKIKKNDLKFLGYQTIMIHFPTSKVSKETKINLKQALKEEKLVFWNTAFVDISSRLISVIAAYRDKQGLTPYKNIANKLVDLTAASKESSIEKDQGIVSFLTLVALIKVPDSFSSGILVPSQNSGEISDRISAKTNFNMANLLLEMKSHKLKHLSPEKVDSGRKRKTSLEIHLATSLEKKFKLANELANENGDE